jgi:hypothetical protein
MMTFDDKAQPRRGARTVRISLNAARHFAQFEPSRFLLHAGSSR